MKPPKKCLLIIFITGISASIAFAQGTVVFANTPTTLVSAGPVGQNSTISGSPGAYYFGLLIAPPGTVSIDQFSFTGIYATNTGLAGRFGSGAYEPSVAGWREGTVMSFGVAGWSSSLGHDWNQQWTIGEFDLTGYFGFSAIGSGTSGGPAPPPAAAFPLFGPVGGTWITSGWNLDPVPEPHAATLLLVAAAAALFKAGTKHR